MTSSQTQPHFDGRPPQDFGARNVGATDKVVAGEFAGDRIQVNTGTFVDISASSTLDGKNVSGDSGVFDDLDATEGTITTLDSTTGTVSTLTSTTGTITTLNSTTATLTNLTAGNFVGTPQTISGAGETIADTTTVLLMGDTTSATLPIDTVAGKFIMAVQTGGALGSATVNRGGSDTINGAALGVTVTGFNIRFFVGTGNNAWISDA